MDGPSGAATSAPRVASGASTSWPRGFPSTTRSSCSTPYMQADADFYLERLYPMQDRVLARLARIETGFYLTGGTAASRGYLHHRFSDDLDFFVNDDDRFRLWAQRVVQALARSDNDWHVEVVHQEARFVRLTVTEADLVLKIEMVNDVPAHVGELTRHPLLG